MYNNPRNNPRIPMRKSDTKLDTYKATINRIIILLQVEQNNYTNATDSLSQSIAGAKVEAFQKSIEIFQTMIKQYHG